MGKWTGPWKRAAALGVLALVAAGTQAQAPAPAPAPVPMPAMTPATTPVQAPSANASVQDIVDRLAPPSGPLTRSLSRNIVPQRRQIDLVVNFDFDSARLQPQSLPQLQRLAEAMQTERLAAQRFRVEGHTDAKGAVRYNEELSSRRARSVVDFLRAQGVSPERLQPEGRGASELLDKDQPLAPENRRVRIVALD
jgi:outer membrane protein OmpA-like peptidoglycan-associated protein